MTKLSTIVRIPAVFLLLALAGSAASQQADYPSRPIRVVIPFAPGGALDFIGPALGQKITPMIGQNFIMDNRPGGGTAVGADIVAKSKPDGYTILLSTSTHGILPALTKDIPFDPVKDFAPISLVANGVGFVLTVHPNVPVRLVKELIALAKSQPGKLNYGSSGTGGATHLAMELFDLRAGTKMTHIPYKGSGQALVDLLGGRLDLCFSAGSSALSYIRAKRLRALAMSGSARWSDLPDVPTIDEAGLKGYSYAGWYAMWFPAGTPTQYVTRIQSSIVKSFEDASLRRVFLENGYLTAGSTPQELNRALVETISLHRELIARAGLAPK